MNTYTHIKEGTYGAMKMHVFGNPRTAEKLVEWYELMKNNPNRSNPKQETPWGLTLTANIVDNHPVVHITIDEVKLQNLVSHFPRLTALHFTDHGVTVTMPQDSSIATLSIFQGDENETFLPIHEMDIHSVGATLYCACVHITDEGFVLERFIEREDVIVQSDELTAEA